MHPGAPFQCSQLTYSVPHHSGIPFVLRHRVRPARNNIKRGSTCTELSYSLSSLACHLGSLVPCLQICMKDKLSHQPRSGSTACSPHRGRARFATAARWNVDR